MTGIYKIINPKGKVYIGQAVNITTRLKYYKGLNCKNQVKLYRSILKYGWENHKVEVLLQCTVDDLNLWERHYQELFTSVEKGLNCKYTGSSDRKGRVSKEVISKLRNSIMGHIVSEETKKKISDSLKGRKHDRERVEKMRNSKIGKSVNKGRVFSDEHKLNLSKANSKPKEKVKCKYCDREISVQNLSRHENICKTNS